MFGLTNKLRGRTGSPGEPGPVGPMGPQGPAGPPGRDGTAQLSGSRSIQQVGHTLYVDNQDYLDPAIYGRKGAGIVFDSLEEALTVVRQGDTIGIYGKIDESNLRMAGQRSTVTDVTLIGMGTRTRPGHGEESAMAGGADWSSAKDQANAPLLTVISQGWRFENIHFGGKITLSRTTDMMESGSHTEFRNCTFSGGPIGIEDHGGSTNTGIFGCHFYGFNKPGQMAIKSTSTSMAWPLWWEIIGNRFIHNHGHIQLALSNGIVSGNTFFMQGPEPDQRNAIALDLSAGKNNCASHNNFCCPAGEPVYAGTAYKMGSGDAWGPNYCSNGEVYGLPYKETK